MNKPLKKVPHFKTEDAERSFWDKHDSAEYLNWSKAKSVRFANLKPSTETISLRLPESMLTEIKVLANKKDIPYQSLIKLILAEKIETEYKQPAR